MLLLFCSLIHPQSVSSFILAQEDKSSLLMHLFKPKSGSVSDTERRRTVTSMQMQDLLSIPHRRALECPRLSSHTTPEFLLLGLVFLSVLSRLSHLSAVYHSPLKAKQIMIGGS